MMLLVITMEHVELLKLEYVTVMSTLILEKIALVSISQKGITRFPLIRFPLTQILVYMYLNVSGGILH